MKYVGRLCATTGCSVILRDRDRPSAYCLACRLDRLPEPVDTFHCEWCDKAMYGSHRQWCSRRCKEAAYRQRTIWTCALARYWDQAS